MAGLSISAPAVGSALSIARRMREKAEKKKQARLEQALKAVTARRKARAEAMAQAEEKSKTDRQRAEEAQQSIGQRSQQ